MLKKYITYLKDNPKGYWFKRKLYGWGWVPARKEGWLVIIGFIAFLVLNALNLSPTPTNDELLHFFIALALGVTILLIICYKTGETPRWQWGLPSKKKK